MTVRVTSVLGVDASPERETLQEHHRRTTPVTSCGRGHLPNSREKRSKGATNPRTGGRPTQELARQAVTILTSTSEVSVRGQFVVLEFGSSSSPSAGRRSWCCVPRLIWDAGLQFLLVRSYGVLYSVSALSLISLQRAVAVHPGRCGKLPSKPYAPTFIPLWHLTPLMTELSCGRFSFSFATVVRFSTMPAV